MVPSQQVYGLGQERDAALGISISGNSRNVVYAFIVAKAMALKTIALTGRASGQVIPFVDVAIRVPANNVTDIQELHLPVYHTICTALEERFFPS